MSHRVLTQQRSDELGRMRVSNEVSRWTLNVMLCRGAEPWEIVAWIMNFRNPEVGPSWVWCALRSAGWPVDQCVMAFREAGWSETEVVGAVLSHPLDAMRGVGFNPQATADALRAIAKSIDGREGP